MRTYTYTFESEDIFNSLFILTEQQFEQLDRRCYDLIIGSSNDRFNAFKEIMGYDPTNLDLLSFDYLLKDIKEEKSYRSTKGDLVVDFDTIRSRRGGLKY